MIDVNVPLLSHDYTRWLIRDVMGHRGLVVIGVGKAGERGFQLLYRFSDISARLAARGVNTIVVYPKTAIRHAFDATSIASVKDRHMPCLFLDQDGRFLRAPLQAKSLCALYLDTQMRPLDRIHILMQGETWELLLRSFLGQIISS